MPDMRFITTLLLSLLFITSYAQHKPTDNVFVLPVNTPLPADAQKISSIKLGNNSTALHCNYEALVLEAKQKAIAAGGNIVKITQLVEPYFISKCYLIKADIYKSAHTEAYKKAVEAVKSPILSVTDNNHYGRIYIYRLADTTAFAPAYDLHLNNDSVIADIHSKAYYCISLPIGQYTFWAETEHKQSVTINVMAGRQYYLRCGLIMGEIRRIPDLQLIPQAEGAKEYNHLAMQKKDIDKSYLDHIH